MSFNSFMQTVAFCPKDVEKSNAFKEEKEKKVL